MIMYDAVMDVSTDEGIDAVLDALIRYRVSVRPAGRGHLKVRVSVSADTPEQARHTAATLVAAAAHGRVTSIEVSPANIFDAWNEKGQGAQGRSARPGPPPPADGDP